MIGVPEPTLGEAVTNHLRPRPGHRQIDPAGVIAWAMSAWPGLRCPKPSTPSPHLPRSPSGGKITALANCARLIGKGGDRQVNLGLRGFGRYANWAARLCASGCSRPARPLRSRVAQP